MRELACRVRQDLVALRACLQKGRMRFWDRLKFMDGYRDGSAPHNGAHGMHPESVAKTADMARARGKKLGREPGQRPKSDRLAPKVLHAVDHGRSYRWIARDLGISKNTVADIVKRHRAAP